MIWQHYTQGGKMSAIETVNEMAVGTFHWESRKNVHDFVEYFSSIVKTA
jgi:hypothetical protein